MTIDYGCGCVETRTGVDTSTVAYCGGSVCEDSIDVPAPTPPAIEQQFGFFDCEGCKRRRYGGFTAGGRRLCLDCTLDEETP